MVRKVGTARIVREIGRGGMGVVYEAEQEALDRPVAVKALESQAGPARGGARAVPPRGEGLRPPPPRGHRGRARPRGSGCCEWS